MEYNTFEEIIANMPLYSCFSLTLINDQKQSLEMTDAGINLLENLFHKNKVRLFCCECKLENTFEVEYEIKRELEPSPYEVSTGLGTVYRDIDNQNVYDCLKAMPRYDEGLIFYTFKCSMSKKHYQNMFLHFLIKDGLIMIRKIGQKPSNTDLQFKLSKTYNGVLTKYNAVDDYKHFEQCESRDLLAGSCTYLRRILQKIVYKKFESLDLSEAEKIHLSSFESKLKQVTPLFCEDIRGLLNNSYFLLNRGIHELENLEIQDFYLLLVEVINTQLDYEYELETKQKRKVELTKKLNNLREKYQK